MARLIVKSPYIKGDGKGGYARYIATRDGVELLPSGYMEYMAERPHSHGLFSDRDNIDLASAIQEVNEYPGNIWTHIISLKREDAERLGFDHAPPYVLSAAAKAREAYAFFQNQARLLNCWGERPVWVLKAL